MARASAWGTGQALAYRTMSADEQADLFCLYQACRTQDAGDAVQAVRSGVTLSVGDLASAYSERQDATTQGTPSSQPSRPQTDRPQTDRAAAPAASRAGGRSGRTRDRGREYADPPSDPAQIFG